VAVIARNVAFPAPAVVPMGIFENQQSEHLYVNMMPFNPWDIQTLPDCLWDYWPIIKSCIKICHHARVTTAYLTIDERPTEPGTSQRRPGLHVESPGVLPLPEEDVQRSLDAPFRVETPGGRYVPGAEHHWGNGLMMRNERVVGGIFMASNVANTTAVWNCHLNNERGQMVGPHGDIEYLRPLLGPCARTLEAGELIWMTDRTPHESLPVPADAPVRRQYFRLAAGTISAWFAHHSTPNPLGYMPDPEVRIVQGDKFALLRQVKCHRNWHCGSAQQLQAARDFAVLRLLLYEHSLGHLVKRFHDYGIGSVAKLCALHEDQKRLNAMAENSGRWRQQWGPESSRDNSMALFDDVGSNYFETDQMRRLLKTCHRLNAGM
jgi:hypothetical protein